MRKHRRFRYVILSAVLVAMFAAPAAGARKERDLGSFGVWRSFAYEEGGQTVCYMVTTKTVKSTPKNKSRSSYLMITHRPIEASTDVFSYGAGALLDSKHSVNVKVGKSFFDLFSVKDTAWARDALTDHKLAAAIRNSQSAQIQSIPSQNRVATIADRFSLTGALPAYRAINKACGLPDVERKKTAAKKPITRKASVKKPVLQRPIRARPKTPK